MKICLCFLFCVLPAFSQTEVPLNVPAGTPLRLYLAKRIPKRAGAPVEAKPLDPVYSFDREVIPAGTLVQGTAVSLHSAANSQFIQ